MTHAVRRHIVVSDIHGCFDELRVLLGVLKYNHEEDELVSVGDLVDKGPKPLETLRFFRETPNTVVVLGNHEDKHVRWYRHHLVESSKGTPNPCKDRKGELKRLHAVAEPADYAYLTTLPIAHRLPHHGVLVVHAGIPPQLRGDIPEGPYSALPKKHRKGLSQLFWARCADSKGRLVGLHETRLDHTPWFDLYDGRYGHVVFGHWSHVSKEGVILRREHATGIDTGGVYGGHLTALVFTNNSPERKGKPDVVQVTCPEYTSNNADYLIEARKNTPQVVWG